MLLQTALELALLAVVAVLLWRFRRGPGSQEAKIPESLKEGMERFVAESDRLSLAFQENLDDRRRLASDLVLKLDRRLAGYKELLAATEEAVAAAEGRLAALGGEIIDQAAKRLQGGEPKANPAAPEVRALVLRLAKKGLSVEEIAVKANLHRGEVELIIDLDQGAAPS
jgi:hypothetical protein